MPSRQLIAMFVATESESIGTMRSELSTERLSAEVAAKFGVRPSASSCSARPRMGQPLRG